MTTISVPRTITSACRLAAATALACCLPALAHAQAPDPNPGALTLTLNTDAPTLYVFRGLVQEADPALTLFPSADLAIALPASGALKSATIDLVTWHSLQTGSSGSKGPSKRLHYEEDFYGSLTLGFAGGVALNGTYSAYTSPNAMFSTVQEVSAKLSKAGLARLNPYGLVAIEVSGQADGGASKGIYGEAGVAPAVTVGKSLAVALPVKVGTSLKNYYELAGTDRRFGYLDIGATLSYPLAAIPARYGTYNVHAGGDYFVLGDTPKSFNAGDAHKFVALVGVGVTY